MPAPTRDQWLRGIVFAVVAVAVIWPWVRIIRSPRNDFVRHYEFGRRFAAGEFLYTGGLDVPYLPAWAMLHAPLTVMPLEWAQPLVYPFGPLSLALLLWIVHRQAMPLPADRRFRVFALTLLAASAFIVRDFDECGANLALAALTWLGLHCWNRGRDWSAGACVGVAAALKCTPFALAGWFLWKRQWKAAVSAALVTAALTLAPALRQGWTAYVSHLDFWWHHVRKALVESDPSIGPLGPEPFHNRALRPAAARWLMRLPADHPGRVDSSAYFEGLNLEPATAGAIIKAVMLSAALAILWLLRSPVRSRDDSVVVREWALLSVLLLLYSPITWGQHCVWAIPALHLLIRSHATGELDRPAAAALRVSVFLFLIGSREIIGRSASDVYQASHLTTAALVALAGATWAVSARLRVEPSPSAATG